MADLTFLSPKTEKRGSAVHGRGLFAREPILRDEIVAVKGGYILPLSEWSDLEESVGPAGEVFITSDLVIAPRTAAEYEGSMMHLNHACDPNVGVEGQIVFVAMRDVDAGEELVLDYAMMDDHDETMDCGCGRQICRGVVTGKDWRRRDLQQRYFGYFSAYLARKIANEAKRADWPALVPELYVTNLRASLDFYLDALGFEVDYNRPEERFAALRLGSARLMLEETPALGRATPEEFQQGQWRTADLDRPFGRGLNLEIEIPDLDEASARIEACGVQTLLEANQKTYQVKAGRVSVRRLLVADPDGYLIRLTEVVSDVEP